MNRNNNIQNLTLPVLALRDQVMLPNIFLSITVGREISINAIMQAINNNTSQIIVVAQKNMDIEIPATEDLYTTGTLCYIRQVTEILGNAYKIYVEGMKRVKIYKFTEQENIIFCNYKEIATITEDTLESSAHVKTIVSSFNEYAQLKGYAQDAFNYINKIHDEEMIINLITNNLHIHTKIKQEFLEEPHFIKQLEMLLSKIDYEKAILKLEEQLKTKSSEAQKERLLEQINAIQNKIIGASDADEIINRKKEKGKFTEELENEFQKALKTFKRLHQFSSDYDTLRIYLMTLLDLPTKSAPINDNLVHVSKILDEHINGQDKVKQKILEQIAVMSRTHKDENKKSSAEFKPRIICFNGPPGVGKTSMAKAIAAALCDPNSTADQSKLTTETISLAGVNDEAQLKGHRRTYVGAMPGQIINAFIRTKITNPVIVLDEIDKISYASNGRGNAESTLLGALDPAQNHEFHDNYINAPFDISKAFFIATANDLSTIHPALLDRMYVIKIRPYTLNEKFAIAKTQLLRSAFDKARLYNNEISVSDNALKRIITSYTQEAGVRNLAKCLEDIACKVAKMIACNEITGKISITASTLTKYLGMQKIPSDELGPPRSGSITGLAWTPIGGMHIPIESIVLPTNTSKLSYKITGLAKQSMSESAELAIALLRDYAAKYDIPEINKNFFENNEFHIHMGQGGQPKDGPSAGAAIFLALLSAVTQQAPIQHFAMTGEISLHGDLKSIGGLEEKLVAAHVIGCKIVCIPIGNFYDTRAMPAGLIHKDSLDFAKRYSNEQDQININSQQIHAMLSGYIEQSRKHIEQIVYAHDHADQKEPILVIPCRNVYDVISIALPNLQLQPKGKGNLQEG